MGNSGKSFSPHINQLMDDGVILADYCQFSAALAYHAVQYKPHTQR